ncbi:MAG TPA: L-aspartate oxidase [Ktedonobacterales bacterium]|jgi:L-aspartate oxidase|nr:L-aspartate oxidase [Ktedonobacterales bacterium]
MTPLSGPFTPIECDVAIIGGGIAGLSIALNLPPSLRVALVTKSALGESNTRYAQGGLAAAVGSDDDPALHLRDTLTAGAGLVDEEAARVLVSEARDAVTWLIEAGTRFDENASRSVESHEDLAQRYDLAREAAHSRRRVLHARDATGAEIERALVAAVHQHPETGILEHAVALDLVVEDGRCAGLDVLHEGQRVRLLARRGVVLANGGAGQLWLRTSNPSGATADGVALAWRAGAVLADLEFAQFHPTTLVPPDPSGEPFLISEAVRGEGAWLRNAAGERFMLRYHPDAELAPRDVVARAILSEMLAAGVSSAFLDLRHLPEHEVYKRFPTIAEVCRRYGLELAHDLIPVAPAAHYFMGGIATDTWGRTTLPGLYAVGEAACTGVHGANRLASNSLLEGLVFGRRVARRLASASPNDDWPCQSTLSGIWTQLERQPNAVEYDTNAQVPSNTRATLRELMWRHGSLARNVAGLVATLDRLHTLAAGALLDPETANMLLAAQLITASALAREESRGGHYRTDFPERNVALDGRHTLLQAQAAAPEHMALLRTGGVARDS